MLKRIAPDAKYYAAAASIVLPIIVCGAVIASDIKSSVKKHS